MGASWVPHVISGLAGLGSTALGAKAQTSAGKQASAAQDRASQASERTITAQMEFEREQRAQDRADAEKRWAAEQEMASRMWAAQEDERLYQRKVYEEDRAAAQAARSGGGYEGPSGPDPRQLRKEQAQRTLAQLLAQGTPGYNANGYTPATAAGPVGRG